MGEALYVTDALDSLGPCSECGVRYAAPGNFVRSRRADGKTYWCPNGHAQCFGQGELTRLREQLETERKAAEARLAGERTRREWAEKNEAHARLSAAALRGELTKVKNRVGNGVCPCCNRSFVNLQRHMGTKHPAYKDQG